MPCCVINHFAAPNTGYHIRSSISARSSEIVVAIHCWCEGPSFFFSFFFWLKTFTDTMCIHISVNWYVYIYIYCFFFFLRSRIFRWQSFLLLFFCFVCFCLFLLTMLAKDLIGCFIHCCVEAGDHWIQDCVFIVHDGERCKLPSYHNLESLGSFSFLRSSAQWHRVDTGCFTITRRLVEGGNVLFLPVQVQRTCPLPSYKWWKFQAWGTLQDSTGNSSINTVWNQFGMTRVFLSVQR